MLRKLMKYEWKSTYKICGALLIFILITTVLGCSSFFTPMWSNMKNGSHEATWIDIAGVFSLFIYIFSIVGVAWGAMIYLGVHYYRELYSDQGYLTHTLPVSARQLLLSRVIIGGVWLMIIMAGVILSCVALFCSLAAAAVEPDGGQNVWQALWQGRNDVMSILDRAFSMFDMTFPAYMAILAVNIILGSFTGVMCLLGALTLGQLFAKHKVMMSIVFYFVIGIIQQVAATIVQMPFMYSNVINIHRSQQHISVNMNMFPNMIIAMVINIITAIVLYFISHYIITKKLNLD